MKKQRNTIQRQEILSLLQKSRRAFSASEVHRKLPHMDLVTIYRNLELFAREGMVKKMHLKEKEAQYEYQENEHFHAVCGDCGAIRHFAADEKIKKLLKVKNFSIEEVDITVRGRCRKSKKQKETIRK